MANVQNCEEQINPKRLAAIPWARSYCLNCQELLEQGFIGRRITPNYIFLNGETPGVSRLSFRPIVERKILSMLASSYRPYSLNVIIHRPVMSARLRRKPYRRGSLRRLLGKYPYFRRSRNSVRKMRASRETWHARWIESMWSTVRRPIRCRLCLRCL